MACTCGNYATLFYFILLPYGESPDVGYVKTKYKIVIFYFEMHRF